MLTAIRVRVPRRHLIAACALLALTGCSSSGGGSGSSTSAPASKSAGATTSASSPAAGGGASQIVIKDFKFVPASLTVAPGATVTVKNEDSTAHTVTATSNKAFDTGDIAPGRTATFAAPKTAGKYDYICTIHQFMKGSLTVS